jgi:hypothetical protein
MRSAQPTYGGPNKARTTTVAHAFIPGTPAQTAVCVVVATACALPRESTVTFAWSDVLHRMRRSITAGDRVAVNVSLCEMSSVGLVGSIVMVHGSVEAPQGQAQGRR